MKRNRPQSQTTGAQSQRQLRVGEMLRHALSAILNRGDLRDPDLAGKSVTVTEVRVSPDLRNATVFVQPLGGADIEKVVSALGRAAPYLRRQIAGEIDLRYMPALSFTADTSFDYAERIDTLLKDVARTERRG
jgi:ribosome-binding factor A